MLGPAFDHLDAIEVAAVGVFHRPHEKLGGFSGQKFGQVAAHGHAAAIGNIDGIVTTIQVSRKIPATKEPDLGTGTAGGKGLLALKGIEDGLTGVLFFCRLPLDAGGPGGSQPARLSPHLSGGRRVLCCAGSSGNSLAAPPDGKKTDSAAVPELNYNRVFDTLRNWRQTPELFQFLLGYYLLSDGIVTIISFTAIYMHLQFGLSMGQILQLTLLFNGIAIPATITFGLLNQRWSAKRLLQMVLVLWMVTLALMVFGTHPLTPVLIACGLGLVVGSTQSICRGMFAQMVPLDQAAEKFGFHALVSKVSATVGPLVFGLISSVSGSQRLAILSMAMFFLAGSWVLFQVPGFSASSSRGRGDNL
jgi:hypothetical protein